MNNVSQGASVVPASTSHSIGESTKTNAMISQLRTGKQLEIAERSGVKVTMGEEQMIRAIDRAVKALQGATTTFEFSVHEKTNIISVKVLNKETGELIREVPPEKTLDLVAKMMEFAGILFDERV
ncbi:flagellar protein FlaG [Paenibacillus sp. IB182496]|uniref:Flagellar protein FlaG n=1 Tax=Paenibacillus sabuli TaxID=2772509 RepID=A0A927BTY4_9BACL|nr:flagellar protein FlaG [Paenibacillus sabuli]MBD2845826.1 flagellar protein FlaG [Paenibacillus sabuli]